MALPKLSVACTDAGASGEVAGIFDDEPMCMHTTVSVSWQACEERVPAPGRGCWAGRGGTGSR